MAKDIPVDRNRNCLKKKGKNTTCGMGIDVEGGRRIWYKMMKYNLSAGREERLTTALMKEMEMLEQQTRAKKTMILTCQILTSSKLWLWIS